MNSTTQNVLASKGSSLMKWADATDTEESKPLSALRSLLRVLLITMAEFNKNELSLRSGALTYTILLSMVPMLAMSTAVVKGLGGGDQLREAAYSYIETLESSNNPAEPAAEESNDSEPTSTESSGENLTDHLRSAIDKLFDYVDRTNFATLGSIGVIGILLSALLVLNHIESAMNAIWKVSSGRSILRKIADYITLLILMPFSINVAFAASAFLESPALASKMDIVIPVEWLQSLLLKPLPIFFITLSFYVMYIFFPNTKVKTFPAILGSFFAALLWFGIQNVYISLQVGVSKYNAIYGSFATLPLFLVWMYLGWIFILTGAQVAFACQNVFSYRLTPVNGAPSLKLGAAFDIMELVQTAFSKKEKLTLQCLTSKLPHYGKPLLEAVQQELVAAKILHLSDSDNRLLPAAPTEQFSRQDIVNLILGKEAPDTIGGRQSLVAIEAAGSAR